MSPDHQAVRDFCCGPSLVTALPPERAAFFGNLHLHNGLSFDAAASGTQTTPEDAYRHARGDSVQYMGRSVRCKQPLDFLAVTDHSAWCLDHTACGKDP